MSKTVKAKYQITAEDKTKAELKRIRANFKKLGQDVSGIGQSMTLGLSAPLLLFGASSLKAAGNFESSMNRVRAISGVTGKTLDAMKQQAKDLGRTTQFSASEAADAMGYLSMAGFKANQVMGAMPATLQLAAAAQMDLAEAADISSNVLTGFGLSVEDLAHANDVMIKTTNSANTDLAQLGEAMAYVAPIASAMGLSLEETAAAIGLLGNAGIQGSSAGTTLKGVLASLANPSAEASKRLAELGVNAFDAQGNMLPLSNVIEQLSVAGMGGGDALKIFGKIAGPGMAALVKQGSGALESLTGELENSGGTAAKAAAIQMEGLNGAIKQLKSAFEGLQLAVADSGLLEWFTKFVEKTAALISKAASVNGETMKMATRFGMVAIAAGPVLSILGKTMVMYIDIAKNAGILRKKLVSLKTPLVDLGRAFSGIPQKISPATTALKNFFLRLNPIPRMTALTSRAMIGLKASLADMPAKIKKTGVALKAMGKAIKGLNFATMGWVAVVGAALFALFAIWANWGDDIKKFLSSMWTGITSGWTKFTDYLVEKTEKPLQVIGEAWGWLSDTISKVTKPVLSWLLDAYSTVYGFMLEGVGKVIQGFGKLLAFVARAPGAPEWMKDLSGDIGDFAVKIKDLGANLDLGAAADYAVGKVKSAVGDGMDFIEQVDWEGAWGGISEGMANQKVILRDQFKDMMDGLGSDEIKALFSDVGGWADESIGGAIGTAGEWTKENLESISSMIGAATGASKEKVSALMETLKSLGPAAVSQLFATSAGGGGGPGGETGGGGGGSEGSPPEAAAISQMDRIKEHFLATFGEIKSFAEETGQIIATVFTDAAASLGDVLGNAVGDLATNMLGLTEGPIMIGRAFKNMAVGIIKDLAGMIVKMVVVSLIAKALGFAVGKMPMSSVTGNESLGGGLTGPRAGGGRVEAGKTYMVGENGPERYTAAENGHITPNNKLGSSLTIGSLIIRLESTLSDDPISIRRVATQLYDELQEVASLHGPEAALV